MDEKKLFDVKITILKKTEVEEIHKEYAKDGEPLICAKGNVGDEFISINAEKPEGICAGAWSGLQPKVKTIASGENNIHVKKDGVAIHSCNDGLHPVIFKLERI